MIIFVRTKTATAELAEKLEARGYSASALNGDMNQALRERTINRLKKRQLDIIVATDVAARGIDVERVSHVLNFDIPYDSEAYVHRIGRTGRAGRHGKAILFVAPREKRLLHSIEKATRQRIAQMDLPTGSEVSGKRIEQFKQQLNEVLENEKLDYFYDILSQYSEENDRSAEEIASALAYLLQRERPLKVEDLPQQKRPRDDKRSERPERHERSSGKREHGPRKAKEDIPMARYRLEVGRNDEVKPGDIVGAIANEAGIESQYIGHIKLHDDHSTVDLPDGMPKELLLQLKKVKVRNKAINIAFEGKAETSEGPKKRKPKSSGSKAKGSKAKKDKNDKPKSKVRKRKANSSTKD